MEKHNLSFELMDIDLSNQSVKDMDISYNDSVTEIKPCTSISPGTSPISDQPKTSSASNSKKPLIKKYHINIQKSSRSYKSRLLKIIGAVLAIIISSLTFQVLTLNCCDQLNLEVLSETISTKLFGQSAAVELMIKTLSLEERSKILFFSGGTGVGKTYTSSLLLNTLEACSNVYHYTMPSFKNTFSTDFMFGLTMCGMSLIIVDDLTVNDMDIKIHIKNVIEKSESLEKNITVILIFNCNEDHINFDQKCDGSFKKKILDNFSKIRALKRFIQFEPLSDEHLKQCIQQELGNRKLNNIELANLLKNFNVSVDGCKGVHSKMKYLNIF